MLKQGGEKERGTFRRRKLSLGLPEGEECPQVAPVSGETQLGTAGGDATGVPGPRRGCVLLCRGWPWLATRLWVLSSSAAQGGELAVVHSR